ncbi:MAG: RNA polymerase sporulation sigma factor SigG [Clostridia bacterium]|nr:RNA polymerase sporulation sigma factor SigG [Clostridia bacterium]
MYYNKVEICGVNTSTLERLTSDETSELLIKAKSGDTMARERLIRGNLRLVLSVIQRFSGRGESMDDLFQVGCIGLMKAIDNFDPDYLSDSKIKFSTYGVPMIIGELRRYLRDNNAIRVSRSVRDLAYKALQVRETLSRTLTHEPTVDEITAKLREDGEKVETSDVVNALDAIVEPVSLFEPVYNDASSSDSIYIMDQVRDPDNSDELWLEDIALEEAMKHLSERERAIIDMRFYKGRTQMEIAAEIGISQAQVSRLEKGALERIRKQM